MKRPLRPGPDHAAALLMGMLFGALMGGPAVHELLYRPTAEELRETDRTNELLMAHSDAQACAMVETALVVRSVPGFERVVQLGEYAALQLPAETLGEKLAFCRGGR